MPSLDHPNNSHEVRKPSRTLGDLDSAAKADGRPFLTEIPVLKTPNQAPHEYDYRDDPKFQARVNARYVQLRAQRASEHQEEEVDHPVLPAAHRGRLLAAAAAGVAAASIVAWGHTTIADGVRTLFPDDSPPVTNPQQYDQMVKQNHGKLPGTP